MTSPASILAARPGPQRGTAHGVGVGWISILDPAAAAATLEAPPAWALIGYFYLGYPQEVCAQPELEREGWERRLELDGLILRR